MIRFITAATSLLDIAFFCVGYFSIALMKHLKENKVYFGSQFHDRKSQKQLLGL